jgi:uncharacterized lipoprotein NlpE involved in copper resistance
MKTSKKQLIPALSLLFFATLFSAYQPVLAETEQEAREQFLKARVSSHQRETDHAAHLAPIDKSQEFHGVFYGFTPCNDCPGIKVTLSLKQNNNYLLVTQPARESSREFYEKGKYVWDDENQTVILTPRQKEISPRHYEIENGETLVQLNEGGTRMTGEARSRYALRRSDTVKSRDVHFH